MSFTPGIWSIKFMDHTIFFDKLPVLWQKSSVVFNFSCLDRSQFVGFFFFLLEHYWHFRPDNSLLWGCLVHHRMNSIPGLYPLDASSTPPPLPWPKVYADILRNLDSCLLTSTVDTEKYSFKQLLGAIFCPWSSIQGEVLLLIFLKHLKFNSDH